MAAVTAFVIPFHEAHPCRLAGAVRVVGREPAAARIESELLLAGWEVDAGEVSWAFAHLLDEDSEVDLLVLPRPRTLRTRMLCDAM